MAPTSQRALAKSVRSTARIIGTVYPVTWAISSSLSPARWAITIASGTRASRSRRRLTSGAAPDDAGRSSAQSRAVAVLRTLRWQNGQSCHARKRRNPCSGRQPHPRRSSCRFSTIQARPPPSAPGKPPLAATRGWAWEAQPVARVEASSRSTSQRTGGTRGVAV
jgi:hypothetical protein